MNEQSQSNRSGFETLLSPPQRKKFHQSQSNRSGFETVRRRGAEALGIRLNPTVVVLKLHGQLDA